MNRKIVHILLIFSIVATQVVIRCAHTHAGCGEDGESLAHIHIGADCHEHGHSHEHIESNVIENPSVDHNHDHLRFCHQIQDYSESNSNHQHLPGLVLDVDENDIQPHDCSAIYFNEDSHTGTLSQNVLVLLVTAMYYCPDYCLSSDTHGTHRPNRQSKAIPGQLPVFLQTSRILV